MVRHTDADARTDFDQIRDADDVTKGATITVDGPDFLPKSDLEVTVVDPEYSDDTRGTVFEAKIPNRSNARTYTFRVYRSSVETTDTAGRFGPRVTARVDPETLPDDQTPEDAADEYAADPSPDTFADVVDAVRTEYDEDDHDPETSTVLSVAGLAARLCADAVGFDAASSRIGFDHEDVVTIPYDAFDQTDPHATPIDAVRIVTYAADATEYDVRYRDGAGEVRMFVDVPGRGDE